MAIPTPIITRSKRSTIGLHVDVMGKLHVHVPYFVPTSRIISFLRQKEDWIQKAIMQVKRRKIISPTYRSGEIFLVLGKKYILTVGDYRQINLSEGKLLFPQVLAFRIKKELENWYIAQAKKIITQRVKHFALQMGATYTNLKFSETTSKWGSCTHDNKLQFRWKLVMAPILVLDSVVIHELAHTFEHNHSDAFWRIVRRFTPAYKQHRKWLDEHEGELQI